MFHKVKNVTPLKDYELSVQFSEGITKKYNAKQLFKKNKIFNSIKDKKLFNKVYVGKGGYGIVWNDDIDVSCDELFKNGK